MNMSQSLLLDELDRLGIAKYSVVKLGGHHRLLVFSYLGRQIRHRFSNDTNYRGNLNNRAVLRRTINAITSSLPRHDQGGSHASAPDHRQGCAG